MATPAAVPSFVWVGASGRSYTYYIYTNPPNFNANQDGNYIYARQDQRGEWIPIYIGQGCLSERCCPAHHKARCIGQKGATHVHAHLNGVEQARLAEEDDLLAAHPEAYEPIGCNEREGG